MVMQRRERKFVKRLIRKGRSLKLSQLSAVAVVVVAFGRTPAQPGLDQRDLHFETQYSLLRALHPYSHMTHISMP